MSNKNEVVFPQRIEINESKLAQALQPRGLTKREYFAANAMQALIRTTYDDLVAEETGIFKTDPGLLPKLALRYADALLEELEKENK